MKFLKAIFGRGRSTDVPDVQDISFDPEGKQLLALLDTAHVTSASYSNVSEGVQKLLIMISTNADIYPQSQGFFIRRALELAGSPNLEERLKAFLLLTVFKHLNDSRVEKAIADIELPRSAF